MIECVEVLAYLLLETERTNEPRVEDRLVPHAGKRVEVLVVEGWACIGDPCPDQVRVHLGVVAQDDSADVVERSMHSRHINGGGRGCCPLVCRYDGITIEIGDEVLQWITESEDLTDVEVAMDQNQRSSDG